ncbi:ATP-binding protein [Ruicaihuangia caeni]|uniref:ATP-binding protein n=1 Tax=Ruicaihuangia caeni TaxID=3042517 RepID=UPI00338F6B46
MLVEPAEASVYQREIEQQLDRLLSIREPLRMLVDGRAGSGKTEFARALVASLPGAQLVSLDYVYPGWGGLDEGSVQVAEELLSSTPRWLPWDWETLALADEWRMLDPDLPIVIEGAGAVSRLSRPKAHFAAWVTYPDAGRHKRAIDRDGDWFAPHWDMWAAQEERFIAREQPHTLVDIVIHGENSAEVGAHMGSTLAAALA